MRRIGTAEERPRLRFGTTVYTEDGRKIGQTRGIDGSGLSITLRDVIAELSLGHVWWGQRFGEAELVWRC